MSDNIGIYVHEITLPETVGNDFAGRFNYCSWLYRQSVKESISKEESDKWWNLHFEAKYALEQGMPISYVNEYKPQP